MLVMTAKLTKKRLIAWVVAVGLVICGVIMVKGQMAEENLVDASGTVLAAQSELKNIKTADDRVALLKSFGWEVQPEPIEFMEVQIPEEFDEVYNKYNEIQTAQGLDLKKYAGKRCMRYSYQVTNYPSGEQGVIANILIYKNKLIGGDVCSPQLNGFMHGLAQPNTAQQQTSGEQQPQTDGQPQDAQGEQTTAQSTQTSEQNQQPQQQEQVQK